MWTGEATTSYDLIAVGDVMADVIAPAPTAGRVHAPVEIRAGGSAVNAARAALAAGRSALVVGCVGDDPLGRFLRDDLERAGIAAALGVSLRARTGRVLFAGGAVVAERGANASFAAEHLPSFVARAVLVSGYQLLREDSGPGAAAALTAEALVGVDLGAAALVRGLGLERTRELVRRADVIFGDEDAVGALGELDGLITVTTLGPDGARACGHHARPPRRVEGELFGAGDAFAATVLLALADGVGLSEALERGCAAASALALPQ